MLASATSNPCCHHGAATVARRAPRRLAAAGARKRPRSKVRHVRAQAGIFSRYSTLKNVGMSSGCQKAANRLNGLAR